MINGYGSQQSSLLAVVLIIAMMVSQLLSPRLSHQQAVSFNSVSIVKSVSSCSQSKSAQSHSGRICQYLTNSAAILAELVNFLISLTGKLYFLFVAAFLASGFRDRPFRPPQYLPSR